MSRTQNAIKNAFAGVISKVLNLIFAFVARTVFIYVLGDTYLGVNGLYSEILMFLSVAELGFGSAMTFAMYKPVVDNDRKKIIQLLCFYKKIYRIIASVIVVLGLCTVPFLNYIVKGAEWLSYRELVLFFLVYLFNTFIGYFVSYKYTYLNALQKNYVQTNIDTVIATVTYIVQIIAIVVFKSFWGYLLINSFVLLCSRLFIIIYLDIKYPILKEKASVPLDNKTKKTIYEEVRGLAVHQFSSVAVHSTDNILISMVSGAGVIGVGLISNYNLIMRGVLGFVEILFNSVTSGFGNLAATSSSKKFCEVFREINFVNFWIYGFCSIALWILVPPFITIWIGADKLVDNMAFTLIIVNCYLQGQSTAYNNARIAKGNFNKDKGWAFAQAITNLVVSVIAAKYLGLVGIYIGTVASRLVYVMFRPYSTYKFLFEESSIEYYKKLLQYFINVIIAALLTKLCVIKLVSTITVLSFVVMMFIVLIVPNAVFLILNCKSEEFAICRNRIAACVSKVRR